MRNFLQNYCCGKFIAAFLLISMISTAVSAETVWQRDFESGDFSKWTDASGNSAKSEWSINSPSALDSSNYMAYTNSGNGDTFYSLRSDFSSGTVSTSQKYNLKVYMRFGNYDTSYDKRNKFRVMSGSDTVFGLANKCSSGTNQLRTYFSSGQCFKNSDVVDSNGALVEFNGVDFGAGTIDELVIGGSTEFTDVSFGSSWSGNGGILMSHGTFSTESWSVDNITLYAQNSAPTIEAVDTGENWMFGSGVDVEVNATDEGNISSVEADVFEGGTEIVSDVSLSNSSGNWTSGSVFTPDTADTQYTLRINATDDAGVSATKNITRTLGNTSLTWQHSGSAEEFRVYSNATSSSMVEVGDVSSKSFEHGSTAIDSGDYICYEVTAYNQYGESSPTPEKCATIP